MPPTPPSQPGRRPNRAPRPQERRPRPAPGSQPYDDPRARPQRARRNRPKPPQDPRFRPRRDTATYEPLPINQTAEAARNIGEWAAVIIGAGLVALCVNAFVVQAPWIPSRSMVPTLEVGDRVLVNKLAYNFSDIQQGDVLVFGPPQGELSIGTDALIKRVIGLPGDTVEARNGNVFVNGTAIEEPYLAEQSVTENLTAVTIPEGHLWMMGDNRLDSEDSRAFGPVPREEVEGKAVLTIWPLTNIGGL